MNVSFEASPAGATEGLGELRVVGALSFIFRPRTDWSGVSALAMLDEFRGRPVLDLRVCKGDWEIICRLAC